MSGSRFHRFVYQLSDPAEFGCAVAGATLQVNYLARLVSAASIERFACEEWAVDTYDAGVKARMYGPLLPGRVALCLMMRDGVSRQYGMDLGEGCLLCNPPGCRSTGISRRGSGRWLRVCRCGCGRSVGAAGCAVEELVGFR